VADIILAGHHPREAIAETLQFMRFLADDEAIAIDPVVARSETETGFRNLALADYMRAHGNLTHRAEMACGAYFHQCAIAMSCRQLARAGLYLSDDGRKAGMRVISSERTRRIHALMMICGHYDGSGDFAYRVGLPGKSGVGGGILAIVPGVAARCAWSPVLNAHGNSLLGIAARAGWSVFRSWAGSRTPNSMRHPNQC